MAIVCITGMHRSGTSMITRLLNLCGMYLGEESELLPVAIENPEGFWENFRFYQVNEQILSSFHGAWDLPPAMDPGWENSPLLEGARSEAHELIRRMGAHPLWGWKDPRNSFTLPFWRGLIPDLKVIVCLRDPGEVALSLAKRGSASRLFSMRLWQSYTEALIHNLKGTDWLLTHYDVYFQSPEAELKRVLAYLGVEAPDETVREACRSVHLGQKHNRASGGGSEDLRDVPAVQSLYADLCSLAGPLYKPLAQAPAAQPAAAARSIEEREPAGLPEETRELIKDLHSQIFAGMFKIRSLEQAQAAADTRIQELESELSGIHGSKAWRLVSAFGRIKRTLSSDHS